MFTSETGVPDGQCRRKIDTSQIADEILKELFDEAGRQNGVSPEVDAHT
jgi:hypothetical protein